MRASSALLDSGANRHIFCNSSLFTSYSKLVEPIPIGLAGAGDGSMTLVIHAIGEGTVQTLTDNSVHSLMLTNVLHTPDASGNLVSIGWLQKHHGTKTVGEASHLSVMKDSCLVITG
jgi:hypothetical protein